mgnify:FL=1
MVKVSVIVPVYNSEKYLNKCIDSILNQTLKEIELILVNDGSTDGSMKILEKYSESDSRVVILNLKNGGPGKARNEGIKIAKGEYLSFVDSDDYIEIEFLEKLYKAAAHNKVQMIMTNYNDINMFDGVRTIINHNLECGRVYDKERIKNDIISTFTKVGNYGFFNLWNKLYLREYILNLDFLIDETRDHGEDWLFNIKVFLNLNSFMALNEPLYNYIHSNSNSLMTKYRENQLELYLDGRKKILSLLPSDIIDYNSLNKNFIYEFSSYIIKTYRNISDKSKRKELLNRVVYEKEVIESCKNVDGLPFNFKIIAFLIRNKMQALALVLYKIKS